MNTARWMLAYAMMLTEQRRQMKAFTRLLGTDLTLFSESERSEEAADTTRPVSAIPLAAIINPTVYYKIMNQEAAFTDSEVPEDVFEMQSQLLASRKSTDLDEIAKKIDEKMQQLYKETISAPKAPPPPEDTPVFTVRPKKPE
jgi:hypothetical protein